MVKKFKIFLNTILFSSLFLIAKADKTDYSMMTKQELGEELVSSAEYKDFKIVVNLVRAGVDVNFKRSKDGCTALHWAAFNNNLKMGEFLIEHGANVNVQTKIKDTPLIALLKSYRDEVFKFEAFYDQQEQVFIILDKVNMLDGRIKIPLTGAIWKNDYNLNVLLESDKKGRCILNLESSDGKKYWFSNVDITDSNRRCLAMYEDDNLQNTYLIYKKNYFKFMKLLLKKGAKVDMQNKRGETALLLAAAQNNTKKCELLLKYDARTDISDNDWVYPMESARSEDLRDKLSIDGMASLAIYLFKILFR